MIEFDNFFINLLHEAKIYYTIDIKMINIIGDYSHSPPKHLYSSVEQILIPLYRPDKGTKYTPILKPLA